MDLCLPALMCPLVCSTSTTSSLDLCLPALIYPSPPFSLLPSPIPYPSLLPSANPSPHSRHLPSLPSFQASAISHSISLTPAICYPSPHQAHLILSHFRLIPWHRISSHLTASHLHLILCHRRVSHLIPSHLYRIPWYPISSPSHRIPSQGIQSHRILFYPTFVSSHGIASHHISPHLIVCHRRESHLIPSYSSVISHLSCIIHLSCMIYHLHLSFTHNLPFILHRLSSSSIIHL